jgi:hypothetical protein
MSVNNLKDEGRLTVSEEATVNTGVQHGCGPLAFNLHSPVGGIESGITEIQSGDQLR